MKRNDSQLQQLDDPAAQKEWLEFQFFVALHNLKEVAPDHYLVTTVQLALQSRPDSVRGDNPDLMMLRNQAE